MTVSDEPCSAQDVRPWLDRIKSPKTDHDDQFQLDDIVRQGVTFRLTVNGQTVGAYVLGRFNNVLWVLAAGGAAETDLTRAILVLTERRARRAGAVAVGFRTERPGLVRKAGRLGYVVTHQQGRGNFLRKNIT